MAIRADYLNSHHQEVIEGVAACGDKGRKGIEKRAKSFSIASTRLMILLL